VYKKTSTKSGSSVLTVSTVSLYFRCRQGKQRRETGATTMTTTTSLTDLITESHARRGTAVVDLFGMRFEVFSRRSSSLRVECVSRDPAAEPVFVGVFGTPGEAAEAILAARETL
jgi:hypothetical protein